MLNVLDCFAGLGGFSLGLERTGGFRTVAFAEISPWRRGHLAERWPGVRCYNDVRAITAERLRADGIPDIDVVTGGFPCKDVSVAGSGAGIDGEHSRLWRELARILGEVRPRFCIMENPAMLLARGLGVILGELAALGFDAEWDCVRACDLGAPHIRDRVWILAYPCRDLLRQQQQRLSGGWPEGIRDQGHALAGNNGANGHVADADQWRRQGTRVKEHTSEQGTFWDFLDRCGEGGQRNGADVADAQEFAERPRLCADESPALGHRRFGDSGGAGNLADASSARLSLPELAPVLTARRWSEGRAIAERGWWRIEPGICRVAYGIPDRVHRLAALGDSLIPQIPEILGRCILMHEAGE